jgi:hypothetical protein
VLTLLGTVVGVTLQFAAVRSSVVMMETRLASLDDKATEHGKQIAEVIHQLNGFNRAQAILETVVTSHGRKLETLEAELRALRAR